MLPILDAAGKPVESKSAESVCPSCRGKSFKPVLGGEEVCVACGHQRKVLL